MKKISVLFIGILALSLIVLSAVATNSSRAAGETLGVQPEALSAFVADGFLCGVCSNGFPFVITTDSHTVVSDKPNTMLNCRGQLPSGSEPAKAVVQDGFLCGTFLGLTTDSHQTITPAGWCNLNCEVK